jgi:predicted RNA binding protein YcfA (HicA-like mRNA interferase family)
MKGQSVTKLELEKKLRKAGWLITQGKAHDQAVNPVKPGIKISIPRHVGDIPTGTAKAILRSDGIE